MSTKKQSTNPFLWVIAAIIIAGVWFGLKFMLDAVVESNAAVDEANPIGNYLVPQTQEVETTAGTETVEAPATEEASSEEPVMPVVTEPTAAQ